MILALGTRKTQYAHTCEIAEGGPIVQEVMLVISVGRLASGTCSWRLLLLVYEKRSMHTPVRLQRVAQ